MIIQYCKECHTISDDKFVEFVLMLLEKIDYLCGGRCSRCDGIGKHRNVQRSLSCILGENFSIKRRWTKSIKNSSLVDKVKQEMFH